MTYSGEHLRHALRVLLACALLGGCGGGGAVAPDTDKPPTPLLQVASGAFDVTATKLYDDCGSATAYGGEYDVVIDQGDFAMGSDWTGTWYPTTATGYGESKYDVETMRQCTVTKWTSVSVTFESEDEFTGTITFRRRVDGECDVPCRTSWNIVGVRHVEDKGVGAR